MMSFRYMQSWKEELKQRLGNSRVKAVKEGTLCIVPWPRSAYNCTFCSKILVVVVAR